MGTESLAKLAIRGYCFNQLFKKKAKGIFKATYGGQDAGGNGQSNGQGGRSFDVVSMGVAHSENDDNETESDEEFDAESLCRCQSRVQRSHAHRAVELARC